MVVECVMRVLKITQMIQVTAILVMVIIVVMTLILDINVIVHVTEISRHRNHQRECCNNQLVFLKYLFHVPSSFELIFTTLILCAST